MRIEERPCPPVAGSPGITQGRYGEHGNLELVAPDVDDGFWVLWANLDSTEHHVGAPLGRWSPGLHVPTGARVDAVRIAQVDAGPDFLECTVLSAGEVQRLHWSPAAGFESAGVLATGVAAVGPLHQDTVGRFSVAVEPVVGPAYRLTSGAERYPELDLVPVEVGATTSPPTGWTASCRSTRGLERVRVAGGRLWHAVDAEPRELVPAVWVD